MFKPKYHISARLLNNIKRITAIVTELNYQKFSKVVLVEFEKSAREISSYSSTSIEGNPLPLTDVKRILKNAPSNARDSEKEVLNYNNALLKLSNLLNAKKISMTMKLVLDIQGEVTKGVISKDKCGKLRKEPVFVNDPILRKTVYLPPDHQDVVILLQDLIDYVNSNKSKVDSLILAGIFHKQFVVIHPFVDGNGRTARLAAKVLMAAMGLDTFSLFSFENYYNKNVTKYFQNVGVSGNYYEIKDEIDFTNWLEYFTDGIIDELLRVEKTLQNQVSTPANEVKPHDKKIIDYIEKNGFITDAYYAKLVSRAKATRNIDFNRLIEMGSIERQGKGKNTYYKFVGFSKK